jgi:CRP-like cAMP-binding protein
MHQPSTNGALIRQIQFLKEVPLFMDLNDVALERLVQDLRLKSYRSKEIVFHQDDLGHELYIVLKGKVRIYKVSPSGDETTLIIMSKHDVFGEFAVIDGRPRSATARTIGPTELLSMSQEKFDVHFARIPELARGVTRLLSYKLRWTASYAAAVAQYDAAARLLHILLLYNEKFGQKRDDGKGYELELSLNQTELASLVGAKREWINRLLRDWRDRGLIEYNPGKITILDLAGVEAERDSRIEARSASW